MSKQNKYIKEDTKWPVILQATQLMQLIQLPVWIMITQGFRDNFSIIKQNFQYAATEITDSPK